MAQPYGAYHRLSKGFTIALVVLLLVAMVGISPPAFASIHTYHEQPGQTTFRSRQSLRDQRDLAWQATLFKRYRDGHAPVLYLRLVGFPGQIATDSAQALQIKTGTLAEWVAPFALDVSTQRLPPNVGQYQVGQVFEHFQKAIPLTLVVPLEHGDTARLLVAPFIVQEWLELNRLTPADAAA